MLEGILIWLIAANVIAFALYGADKFRAIHRKWRIPEATLLLIALLGGGVGAFFGMQVFRHKTKKKKFLICVPICILLNIITALYLTSRLS